MTFIIYAANCTTCRYRNSLNTIKSFCKENGIELMIKNTRNSVANKTEAKSIGQALPFIYNAESELSTHLVGVTYAELERIRGL